MNNEEIEKIIKKINSYDKSLNIMEVCGTHTMAIGKFGFRHMFKNINFISGPGCPVCVTSSVYIDYIYNLALSENIIVATYGDMIRVPGSKPYITLEKAKALGAKVKIVYSSMEALELAINHRDKKILFLGIGFETTTPHTGIVIQEAIKKNISNFFVLSMHKKMEPVMKSLVTDKTLRIDAFLCPGHVAAILGEKGFKFLEEFECIGAIAGFEFEDILTSIYNIILLHSKRQARVVNCYPRLVKYEGNKIGINLIQDMFELKDDIWRGMGIVCNSGYKLKKEFEGFDIEKIYPMNCKNYNENNGCRCGDVLRGKIKPIECSLFSRICTPENPIGPCMVSGEGSCAAYYRYDLR